MVYKILFRIKSLFRLNQSLFNNFYNVDKSLRSYVIRNYASKTISYINPINQTLQLYSLNKRVRNASIKSSSTEIADRKLIDGLKIVYINLAHRIDRKQLTENELTRIGFKSFSRFEAIKKFNGSLGCALSHVNVLEEWNEKKFQCLMVCEDDIEFLSDLEDFIDIYKSFISDDNLDVCCLGFNNFNQVRYNSTFYLTSNTQTTSCYLVKSRMKEPLTEKFKLSVKLIEGNIDSQFDTAIDQVWKSLQKKYFFVIPHKRFVIQRLSYSDIENRYTNYNV